MTTTRFQLNSKDAEIDIYKRLPSAEPNKKYLLTLEQVTIPELRQSIVLNKELFTLERRIAQAQAHAANRAIPEIGSFTPQNCKTELQFVDQVNQYLRHSLLRSISEGAAVYPHNVVLHQYAVPVDFVLQPGEDWFYDVPDSPEGNRVMNCLQCIIRPDGKVGFRFSVDALKLFVIHFTEEGKRVFGFTRDYLAMNVDSRFILDANGQPTELYLHNLGFVRIALPLAAALKPIEFFFTQTIFTHFRHELFLQTSLPMYNIVEIHNNETRYVQQLASYRFPSMNLESSYSETLFRTLSESHKNVIVFEEMKKTNNQFYLTSTDMQNFHVKLLERNYTWNELTKKYDKTEELYPLNDDTFWFIQFTLTPIA